ncbi:MAG: hypothetical protein KJZ83_06385 [Burkholderiaceae bacterium]|nr:hypothetical protein [Burkholderiaceae bacterium]
MIELTSRERVLTALRHEEPDRVPLDLGSQITNIQTVPFNDLKAYLGKGWETRNWLRDHVEPPEELLELLGIDTRYVRTKAASSFKRRIEPDNSYLDEWGVRWKKPEGTFYWNAIDPPLKNATIEDLDSYPWPDPMDPSRTEGIRERAKLLRSQNKYAVVADLPTLGPFECSWAFYRGPDQFFLDLIMDKPFASALLNKITDLQLGLYKNLLDAVGDCVDVVMVADDLGSENSALVSLETYRELVRPCHQRLWGFIKQHTDARLLLHSCGSVVQFLPDLIEDGIEILNPVQVTAKGMDTKALKRDFGKDLTFWGGIDTKQVMPSGTTEVVENEVKTRIRDLAPDGGFVLAAVHNLQPGVPPQNICAMYDSARKFGKYPIC